MEWITDSSIYANGESRAIGLYDVYKLGSIFGLRIGMTCRVTIPSKSIPWKDQCFRKEFS